MSETQTQATPQEKVEEITNKLISELIEKVNALMKDKLTFIAWYLDSRIKHRDTYTRDDIDRLTDWISSIIFNASNIKGSIYEADLKKFVTYMVGKGFDVNDFSVEIYESSLSLRAKVRAINGEETDDILWINEYVDTKKMSKQQYLTYMKIKDQVRQILTTIFSVAEKLADKLAEEKLAKQQTKNEEDSEE